MTKTTFSCGARLALALALSLPAWSAMAQHAHPWLPPSGQQPLTPGQRDLNIEQNRLEREQQQRLIDRALTQPPGTRLEAPELPAEPDITEPGHTVTLSGVDLDFGPQPSLFDAESLVASYLHRPLGNQGIFNLVRQLIGRLYELGYVTSNIALGKPAVVQGRLQLHVNWGRIKGWRIDGKPVEAWRDRTMVAWAMPNWQGAVLNIRDMDQAIENMNNGFKQVTVTIAPAEEYGYSYLDLTVQRAAWARFSVGRDNSGLGTPQRGRDKYNVSVAMGDLLGINDTLNLFTSRRYFGDAAHDGEETYDLAYRIPLGYTRIDLQAGYSSYKNLLRAHGLAYQSAGNSRHLGLRVTRTVYRDATTQFSLYGGLKTRQNKNYLAGHLLAISSKHYSDGTLGMQWSKQHGRHAMFADLSWNRGLGMNQGQYSAFSPTHANAYASRVNGILSWQADFAPGGQLLTVQSQLGFQYSRQMLLNSYQLTLGDEYTVRGFSRMTSQSGDKGVYLSNTVSAPMSLPWFGGVRVTPFVGLDAGVLKNNNEGARAVNIAGWAAGLRVNTRHWNVSATYAKPMWSPLPKKPVWYINTSIVF
ncbi:ShlB/FhaC/HecB family hemolysin secretion/activation protein [Bordetella pseudohinzii]|uniref:TpsB transporter n=3 Tax=Bordetella pseudohinzii TaxID=1331258 RepID=A0A0M7CJ92_9BORD|nr:ShlB/FhaC/HecB family hemolysin secretion/activation protein [Bordetella pseudohinzii]CUI39424.1 TpsB transporter [Bordetella pseudohinzii]